LRKVDGWRLLPPAFAGVAMTPWFTLNAKFDWQAAAA
jgi:hypothetical protein